MATIESIVLKRTRSITSSGGEQIIPDVTISEVHEDEVQITQHPVDTGANISDHAFRMPAVLTVEFAWSDSSRLTNSIFDGSIFSGIKTVSEIYEKLLRIKDSCEKLTVSTGKRIYTNMVIQRLKTTSTADTEACAKIEITFQEILTATTKSVSLASIVQKTPSKTSGVTNGGTRSPSAVDVGGAFKLWSQSS